MVCQCLAEGAENIYAGDSGKSAWCVARQRAGITNRDLCIKHVRIGDCDKKRGQPGYVYDPNPSAQGEIWVYQTAYGERAIVLHDKDPNQNCRPHWHAAQPGREKNFNWGGPSAYLPVDGPHHIYEGSAPFTRPTRKIPKPGFKAKCGILSSLWAVCATAASCLDSSGEVSPWVDIIDDAIDLVDVTGWWQSMPMYVVRKNYEQEERNKDLITSYFTGKTPGLFNDREQKDYFNPYVSWILYQSGVKNPYGLDCPVEVFPRPQQPAPPPREKLDFYQAWERFGY